VRKANGATFMDIFLQILVESVVIAVIGGVAGLIASKGLVNMLALLSPDAKTPVALIVTSGVCACRASALRRNQGLQHEQELAVVNRGSGRSHAGLRRVPRGTRALESRDA